MVCYNKDGGYVYYLVLAADNKSLAISNHTYFSV